MTTQFPPEYLSILLIARDKFKAKLKPEQQTLLEALQKPEKEKVQEKDGVSPA